VIGVLLDRVRTPIGEVDLSGFTVPPGAIKWKGRTFATEVLLSSSTKRLFYTERSLWIAAGEAITPKEQA
jgi:hypothetical protein